MIRGTVAQVLLPTSNTFRMLLSGLVLLASAVIGWYAPEIGFLRLEGYELFVILLTLLLLLVIYMRSIEVGVLSLVACAFFVRTGLGTGTASKIPPSLILSFLVLGVWLIHLLLQKRFSLYYARVTVPLLLFILIAVLSMPWSWLFWRPDLFLWRETQSSGTPFELVQSAALSVMVMLPVVFLIALNTLKERKWYIYLFALVVGIGLPELLQRWFQFFPRVGPFELSGPGLYHVWLIPLAFAQVLFNDRLPIWFKGALLALVVGWFYFMFVGKITWVSGWGPPLVALLLVSWLKSKRLALLFVALLLLFIAQRPDYYYDRIIFESQQTDFNRFWLWRTIIFDLTLLRSDAILGSGPAGYAPYFQTYYPGLGMSAHNNFVDIIAQTGMLGFGAFMWFLSATFRTGWEQRHAITDPFLQAFNNGVLGGFTGILSAMMLNDWLIPFAYNTTIAAYDYNVYAWILLGTMVGLRRFARLPTPDA